MQTAGALTLDTDVLSQWIGKSETCEDVIDAGRARRMQATLDREPDFVDGQELPPFWHYIYFNPETRASQLKEDGHEKLGRFLPPVALPRRMWAGGKISVSRPLCCGETCTKTSTIRNVILKQGRSGPLCFVTVDHEFTVAGAPRFSERQDIVYRQMPTPGSDPPGKTLPSHPAADGFRVNPDPVLLFRYSALIFYGHRIHYDVDYARDVEGYPGLVVHGPLLAGLAAEFGRNRRRNHKLDTLEIRALSPVFAGKPFHVELSDDGDITRTWVRGDDGALAMTVDATFASLEKDP